MMFVAYQKISSFKSPYDKFLTISKAWEIISHYVSLIDDPGVDVMWSIMASGNPFNFNKSDTKSYLFLKRGISFFYAYVHFLLHENA